MRGISAGYLALLLLSITAPAYAARTIRFPDEAVGTVSARPSKKNPMGAAVAFEVESRPQNDS